MGDAAAILENARRWASSRGGKERVALWGTSLRTAVESPGFLQAHGGELAALVLETLPSYEQRAQQRAVNRLLRAALAHECFLQPLAAAIVRGAAGGRVPPQHALRLLEWSCLVLEALPPEGSAKAASKLLEVQGQLLDVLLQAAGGGGGGGRCAERRQWAAAQRAVLRLLRVRPSLWPAYLQAAAGGGSAGLVRVALEVAMQRPGGQQQQQQQQQGEEASAALLPVLCDRVLAGGASGGPALLAAYGPLLAALSPGQLGESVLPASSRGMRRTPEPAIAALAEALGHVQLDMSAAAPDLAALLLQQLRAKEAVRGVACAALAALAARVADPAAGLALVRQLTALLGGTGPEGKVKVAAERAALAGALASLAALPEGGDMQPAAAEAAGFCSSFYKEEPVDEVKAALMGCLAQWLPRGGAPPAPVAPQLAAGLGEAKEVPRRACLGAAVAAVRAEPALAGHLAALAPPLAKLAQEGVAKAVSRASGIAALLVAAHLAAADARADAVLDKAGVWGAPLEPDSPLLAAATLAKLSAADAVPAAELAHVLLAKHAGKLKPESHEAVCRLMALCLLHRAPEVRRTAVAACRSLLADKPGLMAPLLAALRHWANAPGEALVLVDTAAGEAVSPVPGTYSHAFSSAVLALLPPRPPPQQQGGAAPAVALPGDALLELLLAAHHPATTAGVAHKRGTWERACCRLGGVQAALKASAADVAAGLFGPRGLGSAAAGDVAAAQLALGSAMAAAPSPLLEPVLSGLGRWLDRAEHDALSADDVQVYNTPEGVLSSEVVPEGVYVPEVVASKNVRKARGRYKTEHRAFATLDDDDEDDEPPPPPPPPKPAARGAASGGRAAAGGGGGGKGPKDAAARQAEFRARKLQEEAEVRARVAALKARLDVGLEALQAAVDGNRRFAAGQLRDLSAMCQPLLASPVSGEAAFSAVRSLARCMPPPLGDRSLLLAGCLRLVALAAAGGGAEGVTYASIPSRSAVADVVAALSAATLGPRRPLPGPSYALVFPVLAAVLRCPTLTPQHEAALGVLALHVAPEQDVPRAGSLELLYSLLGTIPAYRDRVAPLLRSLCAGAGDAELPAAVSGLLAGSAAVRAAALAALPAVPTLAEGLPPADPAVLAVLALARRDVDEANAAAAAELWERSGAVASPALLPLLVGHLAARQADARAAAAGAIADALREHPAATPSTLAAVLGLFGDDAEDEEEDEVAAAVLLDDAQRAARAEEAAARAAARLGVAAALEALAPVLPAAGVRSALDFLVSRGLGDANDAVREAMVGAGVALVEAHGASLVGQLSQFESYLQPGAAARLAEAAGRPVDERKYDLVREGLVVLLGMMAGHLAPGDDKRRSITELLLGVLSTPSEAVQRAVSNCLPRLVAPLAEDRPYVEALAGRLLDGLRGGGAEGYGLRRGCAYGLAGLVKGLGIGSLKGYGLLDALKARVEDKRDPAGREGALMAFECLCDKLGRLFEPYVIHILPLLLGCFGDASPQVRAAAEDAARSIMGQLSASGVKLVLPALLKGLEDPAWRTKQGSIQLLGAMAHCAPKQLGSCLPTIVPRLGGVLADPHPKVQAAAKEALQEVGSVIRSPEMAALVPALLAAIADPNASTRPCLDTLLATTFVNTIDAPSLALVAPVVHRGLRDRSGDTKKRAARIVGNLAAITSDAKDMAPYVPLLMPELQKALLDPLPEVRATAARAMGRLLAGMGPSALGDLLPWLLATLRSEGSSVERSGAAQGLAEVLAVMGEAHLAELLPELCAAAASRNPYVREGHLTLFRYLPVTMEEPFRTHLGEVLPSILDGLSDEAEGVRDAALAAGRCFVDSYARSCLPLLLPAVEAGLDGHNWRIRHSSLELLGELLFKVAGTSGKVKVDGGSDDEGVACETYSAAISEALGREAYAAVLAKLYVARSDGQYLARTTALHVWKTIVVNTPRTLQEILPALMAEVIAALADPGEDRRAASARCLGELVRKMGERVLHRMLPILRETMASPDAATRQGVCTGLKELLENVTRHQLTEHLAEVLPPIQGALCDEDAGVRAAAGEAFGVLFKGGASGAAEAVVPSLLHGLDSPPHATQSLEALRVILGVRPQVFNGVAPKLLKPPVSSAGLRAIGQLAGAAAPVLNHHVAAIMNTCLHLASGHAVPPAPADAGRRTSADGHAPQPCGGAIGVASEEHDPREAAAAEAALAVALAVDNESLHILVAELLKGLEDVGGRALGAARLLASYARETKQDLQPHVDELLTALVLLLAEDDVLVMAAWSAAEAVAATIPKEDAGRHVGPLKEAVAGAKEKERRKRRGGALRLRGLTLPPKALAPFVPIYLQALLQGSSPEVREVAAEGLGELVSLTSEEGLKPFVVAITGPLIRIIGDRFPPATKAAILGTLGLLIGRAGAGLKPFVPQLQTTFLKCLNDQAPAVRLSAASNLGALSRLSVRVEQLVGDLAASAASAPEPDTAAAYLVALSGGLAASGDRLGAACLDRVRSHLLELYRVTAARPLPTSGGVDPTAAALVGALAAYAALAGPAGLADVLNAGPLGPGGAGGRPEERELAAMLLAAVAKSAAGALEDAGLLRASVEAAVRCTRDELAAVKIAGGRAMARLYVAHRSSGPALVGAMTTLLGPDQAAEVQRQALSSLTLLAAGAEGALAPHLPSLLPCVCSILQREPNSHVKRAAEQMLKHAFGLTTPDVSLEAGQAAAAAAGGSAKAFFTDAYMRRLAKVADDEWVGNEEY